MKNRSRRGFLAATTLVMSNVAGCSSMFGDDEVDGEIRPAGEPNTIPPGLECEDDSVVRLRHGSEKDAVQWGDHSEVPVQLRVSETSVTIGEELVITLTNTGEQTIGTGVKSKVAIELRTEAGWEEVRVRPEGIVVVFHDLAIHHDPGEGFEWQFAVSDAGIPGSSPLEVCPSLQPGRYRFVFWGLGGEDPLAVSVDVDE